VTTPDDAWAAMKPTGSAPKPPQRSISKAPRPAPPIIGHGPAPPAAYVPLVPPGFVAFSNIPKMLAASAEGWRVPTERMPVKADLAPHAQAIEDYLAVTNNQAAGIREQDGSLWWAPGATWRTPCFVDGMKAHAAVAAMHGKIIPFPGKYGPLNCDPILSCQALALAFGAANAPPAPPQSVLSDIREIAPPQKRPPRGTQRAESAPAPLPATDPDAPLPPEPVPAPSATFEVQPDRRGRPRHKRDAAVAAMLKALNEGVISYERLAGAGKKELPALVPGIEGKETMLVQARREAIAQLTAARIRDN
jgi:hypothetical protein